MRQLGREMIRGQSGFVPFESLITGKKCWMVYAPLSASGWSLGVLFPQDELMADISSLNRTVLFISLIGFLLILGVIVLIAGSITRPLRALSKATEDIGSGNLDVEIPSIKSRDEVGKLAVSFNYMKSSLKKYIKELTETTAAKERIESELKIARDIQMGMLHPHSQIDENLIYMVPWSLQKRWGGIFMIFSLWTTIISVLPSVMSQEKGCQQPFSWP